MKKIAWDVSSVKLSAKDRAAAAATDLVPLRAPSAVMSSPNGTKIAKLPYTFTKLCPEPMLSALEISCNGIRFPCSILVRMRAGSRIPAFSCSVIKAKFAEWPLNRIILIKAYK